MLLLLGEELPDRGPDVFLRAEAAGADSSFSSAANSNHSGGCNAMMADGSVRFVKSSIARLTWMQIGTRAGGEVVSSDAY